MSAKFPGGRGGGNSLFVFCFVFCFLFFCFFVCFFFCCLFFWVSVHIKAFQSSICPITLPCMFGRSRTNVLSSAIKQPTNSVSWGCCFLYNSNKALTFSNSLFHSDLVMAVAVAITLMNNHSKSQRKQQRTIWPIYYPRNWTPLTVHRRTWYPFNIWPLALTIHWFKERGPSRKTSVRLYPTEYITYLDPSLR